MFLSGFNAGRSRPGMVLAGVAGAILTVYSPVPHRLLAGAGLELFVGGWLGLALALYFAWLDAQRSLVRPFAMVLLAAGAYYAATMTAFMVELPLHGGGASDPHAVSLAAGGAVGAAILAISVFGLYGRLEGARQRIAICAGGGAVLGVVGFKLGLLVQPLVQTSRMDERVLFLVWQPGMTFVMGLLWPQGDRSAAGVSLERRSAPTPSPERARIPVVVVILVLLLGAVLFRTMYLGARTRGEMRENERAMAVYGSVRPSLERLPGVLPRPINRAVIAGAITDHRFEPIGPVVNKATQQAPQYVEYLACYSNVPGDTCAVIEVRISEYPTREWAAYAMRGFPAAGFDGSSIGTEAMVTRGGQRYLERRMPADSHDVYWTSGTSIVRIRCHGFSIDDVLAAYLERYPSSLPGPS